MCCEGTTHLSRGQGPKPTNFGAEKGALSTREASQNQHAGPRNHFVETGKTLTYCSFVHYFLLSMRISKKEKHTTIRDCAQYDSDLRGQSSHDF